MMYALTDDLVSPNQKSRLYYLIEATRGVSCNILIVVNSCKIAWLAGSCASYGKFPDVGGRRVNLMSAGGGAYISRAFLRECKKIISEWAGEL